MSLLEISCTRWCCSPPPGIGDRPKCDRGLVPCPLVGSASTVGWSGRAEVLRRRRSCRQHSRPHQPDSIDITALRHNLSLRLLPLLSPHLYVLLPVPPLPGQNAFQPAASKSSGSRQDTPAHERECVVYCRQLSPFIPFPVLAPICKTLHPSKLVSTNFLSLTFLTQPKV